MCIPKHWGSAGRINFIGSLNFYDNQQQLSYRQLEGSCKAPDVLDYLDALARKAQASHKLTVVVLDNAGFHKAKIVQQKRPEWESMNLYLRYLPPYSPQLNPIETTWRRIKGFLMPRRCYASREQLKLAIISALAALDAIEI